MQRMKPETLPIVMSENKKDLLKLLESFSTDVSAEGLSRGIRRLLLLVLIDYVDGGLSNDLDCSFFEDLETLFDLLDRIHEFNQNNNL